MVAVNLPFLVNLVILKVALPLELVLPIYVLPLTFKVTLVLPKHPNSDSQVFASIVNSIYISCFNLYSQIRYVPKALIKSSSIAVY